jgi:hypothetical protein
MRKTPRSVEQRRQMQAKPIESSRSEGGNLLAYRRMRSRLLYRFLSLWERAKVRVYRLEWHQWT